MRQKLLILSACFMLAFSTFVDAQTDVILGTNNVPIVEVQFTYQDSLITQTNGVTATNTAATDPVDLSYFKLANDTLLYPFSSGSVVNNNNFDQTVVGVGIYEEGNFILATDPGFEVALEDMANGPDLMQFLYYDSGGNLPPGDDFDVALAKGVVSGDYVSVGERNGNTFFTITPIDEFGVVIPGSNSVRFGFTPGTASGNGTTRYDWDIGYAPSNIPNQSMVYSVIEADLFNIGSNVIFGFRIDNLGDADVKVFGLTDSNTDNNPTNTQIAGIAGNVFNDANGLADATVNGPSIATPDGQTLYANLYDPVADTIIASVPIAADGSFEFLDLDENATYAVSISINEGVQGASVPAQDLPAGWMYTGDNDGTGAGNDGTVDGDQNAIIVTTVLNDEINFGIQQIPEVDPYTFPITNPIPNSSFTIGDDITSDLTGNDPEDGTLGTNSSFGIASLPANGNDIVYDGVVITVGADGINPVSPTNPFIIDDYDPSLLEIVFNGDPAQTSTTFEYVAIDEAGGISEPVEYTLTYDSIELPDISGNIFNDGNGLSDNTVNGPTISTPDGQTLYANLYDPATGDVIESVAVDANGYFEFLDLDANTTYGVSISTNEGTAGSPLPAQDLPNGWMYTGDNDGTGAGDDGTVDGNQPGVILTNTDNDEINFGIQEIPEVDPYTFPISNPIPGSSFTIGDDITSDLTGTDSEDGTLGTNSSFGIASLPSNGNDIVYDGVVITVGADGINPVSPTNPFIIDDYDPALLEIVFNGDLAQTSTTFEYVAIDEAGGISEPEEYTLTFDSIELPDITGNIFNDANGLTDDTVNGPTISTPDGQTLYANLYDPATGDVLESVAVDANGYFEFLDLNPDTTYGVSISTNQGTVGSPLPAQDLPNGWMYTGDNDGTGAGDDGTVDGNQPGVILTNTNNDEINFGIQEIPEADPYSFVIADPEPNSSFVVGSGLTSDLSGTDSEDGSLGSSNTFGITGLPTNGNDIVYNGVTITVGEDGINPVSPTNPFVIDNYDPSLLEIVFNGNPTQTSTTFEYVTFDEAGASSVPVEYMVSYLSLPVEWMYFNANKVNEATDLQFATATETNNSHFEIERSSNGENFQVIATIEGKGNSVVVNEYQYTDREVLAGTNYYRVKQVDFDGKYSYTEVELVIFNHSDVVVYPNPASTTYGILNIQSETLTNVEFITIYNTLGVEVLRTQLDKNIKSNSVQIDISTLTVGTYVISLNNRNENTIFTVIR